MTQQAFYNFIFALSYTLPITIATTDLMLCLRLRVLRFRSLDELPVISLSTKPHAIVKFFEADVLYKLLFLLARCVDRWPFLLLLSSTRSPIR